MRGQENFGESSTRNRNIAFLAAANTEGTLTLSSSESWFLAEKGSGMLLTKAELGATRAVW
jgi:hypothetical protein